MHNLGGLGRSGSWFWGSYSKEDEIHTSLVGTDIPTQNLQVYDESLKDNFFFEATLAEKFLSRHFP